MIENLFVLQEHGVSGPSSPKGEVHGNQIYKTIQTSREIKNREKINICEIFDFINTLQSYINSVAIERREIFNIILWIAEESKKWFSVSELSGITTPFLSVWKPTQFNDIRKEVNSIELSYPYHSFEYKIFFRDTLF